MQLHVSAIQVGEDRRRLEQICHLTGNGKPPTACRKCKLERHTGNHHYRCHHKNTSFDHTQRFGFHYTRYTPYVYYNARSVHSSIVSSFAQDPVVSSVVVFPFFAQKMHTNLLKALHSSGSKPTVPVGPSREVNAKEKEKKSKKQRLYATLATPPSIKHRQLRPVHVSHKAAPHLGSGYGCP